MKWFLSSCVVLTATPVFAQDEIIGVRVREWFERMHGSIQSTEPPVNGDVINLSDDLGLGEQELAHEIQAYLHIPVVGRIYAGWWWAHASGEETLTRDLSFAGNTFTVGTDVKTRFDLNVYYLSYEFALPVIPLGDLFSLEIGIEAGVRGIEGKGKIEATGMTAEDSGMIPLPVLGGHVTATVASWVRAEAEVVGLTVSYSNNRITYLEASMEVVATPLPWIFAGVGYKFASIDLSRSGTSKDFDLQLGLKGFYLTAGIRF